MRIVAYHITEQAGKVLITESTSENGHSNDEESVHSNNLTTLLSFLHEDYGECLKVVWNLDQSVSVLLKLFGIAVCRELKDTNRGHIAPFNFYYLRGKVFSCDHIPTRSRCNLYGLEQYFPELPEPEQVGEIQALGEKLTIELKKMGMAATKLTSPIAIYEGCVLSKLDLPKLKDIPPPAAEMAWRCTGHLWIESHILGYFDKAYGYDLSSAFPNMAKTLVDIRCGKWVHSADYRPLAIYGYVQAQITIYDWVVVHPVMREVDEGLLSPVGTWEGYYTKSQLDFITCHKIGEYKIIDGHWFIPSEMKQPLREPMAALLKYKEGTELQHLLAKRMSTGIYGKMGEERAEEFGPYFNPCWFAEISTGATLQVGDFLYKHGIGPGDNDGYKNLLHIGVDGIKCMEQLEIKEDRGWRFDYEGPVLIWSSGLVYTNTTRPQGLTLADILEMIAEHPKRSLYKKVLTRRMTLGDALAQYRLYDIGKPTGFSISLNLLTAAHDRDFPKLPETGGQLLQNQYRSNPRRV